MITLQCKLKFKNREDREKILSLMRRFSSAQRYAYKRLLEGKKRNELKRGIPSVFGLNTRYADDAIKKAQGIISLCKEGGKEPQKVIFGGRKLFEKLKRKHLNGKRKERLKQIWQEERQGNLYSRGDKSKKGNLNLRFVFKENDIFLRANVGERRYVYAKVMRNVTRENDRWIDFCLKLSSAENRKDYFPYSVGLKLKDGEIYALVSYEENLPEEIITKENGCLGIDINASPFHMALAGIRPDGNLQSVNRISLHKLLNRNRNQREYLSWQIAHQIVEMAIVQDKIIAIEKLGKMPKGKVGDGCRKLRKRLQKWIYRGLLEKVKMVAKREGVEVIEVNPAYTSIIGALKYAPQYSLDKDVSAAFVIARKALGFKERLPRNYEKLIVNKEYQEFAMKRLTDEKQRAHEAIKTEGNQYKKRPLKRKISKLNRQLKIIQNLCSESQSQKLVNRWKEQVRNWQFASYKLWQVAKVALTIPILGKSLNRDLSPLKSILVSGDWDMVVSRLAPVSWDRGYGVDKYRQLGICPHLNEADNKYPSQNCGNVRFC